MSRVLILGAYGLIGAEVVRHIRTLGHEVIGLGRDETTARRVFPNLNWVIKDLRELTTPAGWRPLLAKVDAVVNCAGALQDGGDDDLAAIHHDMLVALAQIAREQEVRIIQISAAGASETSSTTFFRSKAQGDAALMACGAPVWILRPGLVIAQQAYGGTALLRQLAAVPLVQPMAMARAPVQCVAVADVARAVGEALAGELPSEHPIDLVEKTPRPLADVVAAHRAWLGFPPARLTIVLPVLCLSWVGRIADGLGRLGWRSPLRSTAITVLKDGVQGDPSRYSATGKTLRGLDEFLAVTTVGAEHRLQARLGILMPFLVLGLSLFWLASGLIGIWSVTRASDVLVQVGWPFWLATLSVLFWAVVDILLAVGVMLRKWTRHACAGMVAVSLTYLFMASWVTPALWLDPLGPLVKILPVILCALVLRVMLETR